MLEKNGTDHPAQQRAFPVSRFLFVPVSFFPNFCVDSLLVVVDMLLVQIWAIWLQTTEATFVFHYLDRNNPRILFFTMVCFAILNFTFHTR